MGVPDTPADHKFWPESTEKTVVPPAKELVLRGRAALADRGIDPDDRVTAEADDELRRAIPANTIKAINYQWGRFLHWCGQRGRRHDPPTVATMRQYIVEHWYMTKIDPKTGVERLCGRDGQPYAYATVEQAVYLISTVCGWHGWVSPVKHPSVEEQLNAYRKKWKRLYKVRQAHPLTLDQNVQLSRHAATPGTVAWLRNAIAFRLQWDMGARVSELLDIQRQDLTWLTRHHIDVHLAARGGKTPESERHVPVQANPAFAADVDPALLLPQWLQVLDRFGFTDGLVFREVHSTVARADGRIAGRVLDEPWEYDAYELALKKAARQAGVDVDPVTGAKLRITSHSNRAGLITEARDAGVPREHVQARVGYADGSRMLDKYYRSGRRWGAFNPSMVVRNNALGVAGTDEEILDAARRVAEELAPDE